MAVGFEVSRALRSHANVKQHSAPFPLALTASAFFPFVDVFYNQMVWESELMLALPDHLVIKHVLATESDCY